MMSFSRILPCFLVLLFLGIAFHASTGWAARKAFIVGINDYENLENLNNAQQDARDLNDKLTALGFDTTLIENGNKRSILRQLAAFTNNLAGTEAALFYFAGHGMHNQGTNWLIPGDALLQDETDLEVDGLSAEDILHRIANAGPDMTIMLLDACRDNPLGQRSRSLSRGLGLVNLPGGANGTLVGYAAGIGEVAQDADDRGRNGLYTGALLRALDEPGLTIEQVMKRVRADVSRQSGGNQSPWTLASINGDFVFNRAASYSAANKPVTTAKPAQSAKAALPELEEVTVDPYEDLFRPKQPGTTDDSTPVPAETPGQPLFTKREWVEGKDDQSRQMLQALGGDLPYRFYDQADLPSDGILQTDQISRYWYSADDAALRIQLRTGNMVFVHFSALSADSVADIRQAINTSRTAQSSGKPGDLDSFMKQLLSD